VHLLDLIFHQRNQRGDDKGQAPKSQRRDLIAERFSTARRHDGQRIPFRVVVPEVAEVEVSRIVDGDVLPIDVGVIEKCSAYAAREHGDARRAIELLRVSAELAERSNSLTVALTHLDEAEEKIERDRIVDAVKTQPRQFQAVIYAILTLKKGDGIIFTGEIYERYKALCDKLNLRPLTQRRVSDILAELDMLGVINAKVISKGRFGRTREISLSLSDSVEDRLKKMLEEELA
jgi:Cdc6-like AAA superfamily ATPase